jgi:glutamate dehydrogenase (NAD(P)+)
VKETRTQIDTTKMEDHYNHPLFVNAVQSIEEAGKLINCDPNIIARLKNQNAPSWLAFPFVWMIIL